MKNAHAISVTRRATAAAIGALFLSTASFAQAQGPVEIRVSSAGGYMKPVYEDIARRFEASRPGVRVKIEIAVESWDDHLQRTLLDAGVGNKPDVTEQGLNRFETLADRGIAQALDPLIAGDRTWNERGNGPALVELGRAGGKVWGLPFRLATPIVYVNADLVRSAGGDPAESLESWSDLIALARRITDLGGNRMGLYYEYEADGAWLFLTLLNLQGSRAMSADGRTLAFDGPAGLKVFELFRDMGRSGMIDMPRTQARQGFVAGTTGILITAGSQIETFKRQIAGKFKLITAPLPRLAENAKVPVGGGVLMVLADDPARRQVAYDFVTFATSAESQAAVVERTGLMPANDRAGEQGSLNAFYERNPEHRANLAQVPIVTSWETFPGPNGIKITDVIREVMRSVVTGRLTPGMALAQLKRDVEALLPRS